MTGRDVLISLSLEFDGDWDKIMEAVRSKRVPDYKLCESWKKKVRSRVVTMLDADYPHALRQAPKPPIVLFYYGDLSLIQDPYECVSYVGSREASDYGIKMARTICRDLAKEGVSVVSGLAIGIDKAAAEGAYPYGRAVAGIGNGIDYCYPTEHSKLQEEIGTKGLLISEYPNRVKPDPKHFPMRNRIIAALSQLTVVGEAGERSGTMITVGQALSIGRDVCCIPQPADKHSFCNTLIQEGAYLVQNADDVLYLLGYAKKKPLP